MVPNVQFGMFHQNPINTKLIKALQFHFKIKSHSHLAILVIIIVVKQLKGS